MQEIRTAPRAKIEWARRRAALFRSVLAPPPRLTVSEWTDRYRYLSREASAEPGKWSTDRAPYQRGVMDAFSDLMVEDVVLMWASQTGKTECLNNLIGYFIDQDPAPILVIQPTLEMAEAWSKDRLAPMLRDTPRLRGKVRDPRSRDSGNTVRHKVFPGGHITTAGANSPASLASRPIRVVLADEVDRYPPSAGAEGDPFALAVRRTATFWNRKLVRTSTPTLKGFSAIERAFQEPDRRRYYYHVPCPECGHYQTLRWENVRWEDGDPESAAYACEACGVLIGEERKLDMLRAGRWVAENEEASVRKLGFHLNALYSPWARWAEIVREFLAAKENPELLRVWVNTILAETWEEAGEQLSPDSLASRREKYSAEVPGGVGVLTAAVDVQADRLEVLVVGWGAGEESWRIHYEQIPGDPAGEPPWQALESVLTRGWRHEHGAELRIAACCIDSGFHTEAVYRFVRPRQTRRVWAIKGISQPGRALVGKPSRANKYGVKLLPIGVDTAKDVVFSRLRIAQPGPGYLHFPEWLSEEYFLQLTAEKAVTKFKKGRPVRVYERIPGRRNEALDLECYALAALLSLGDTVVRNLGTWVERVREQGEKARAEAEEGRPPAPKPQAPAAPTIPRIAGWIHAW